MLGIFFHPASRIVLVVVVSLSTVLGFLIVIEMGFDGGVARFMHGNTSLDSTNLLMSLLYSFDSKVWLPVQVVLYTATALIIGLITLQIVGGYRLQSALLTAVTPTMFLWTASQTGEILLLFFASSGFYYLLRYLREGQQTYGLLCSICLGLALMTRGTLIVFPFVGGITMFFIYYLSRRMALSKALYYSLLPFAVCFVVIGAVNIKNYQSTGYAFWSVEGGRHLLFWVYPCLENRYGCGTRDLKILDSVQREYENHRELLSSDLQSNEGYLHKLRTDLAHRKIREIETIELFTAIVAGFTKQLIYTPIRNVFGRLGSPQGSIVNYFLKNNPTYQYKLGAVLSITIVEFFNIIIRILQSVGLISLLVRSRMREEGFLLLAYLVAAISTGVGFGNPRYRTGMEVAMIPLLFVGLASIKQMLEKTRFNRAGISRIGSSGSDDTDDD